MKIKRWFKIYAITFLALYILGTFKTWLSGYCFFCDGWNSYDQNGSVVDFATFIAREVEVIALLSIGSVFMTFLIINSIDRK